MATSVESSPTEVQAKPSNSEVAGSVKLTMKALKEYLGLRSGSEREKLLFIGSEFGRIVSRNMIASTDIEGALDEISGFWNSQGLGEMEIIKGTPFTFTIRNCYDCIAAQAGDTLWPSKKVSSTRYSRRKCLVKKRSKRSNAAEPELAVADSH